MNPRQAVLCDIAIREAGNKVRRVDLRGLLRRLLLFEKVIVKSVALQEVSILACAFQRDGLKQLIESGVLRFSVEDSTVIIDIKRPGVARLPPFHFNLGQATLQNVDEKLRRHLTLLESVPGLKQADRTSLEMVNARSRSFKLRSKHHGAIGRRLAHEQAHPVFGSKPTNPKRVRQRRA
jgi:hypothetical protein